MNPNAKVRKPTENWTSINELKFEKIEEFKDNVYEPNHYSYGKYECINVIKDIMSKEEFKGYLRGNVIKYVWRYRHKNGLEDLKKAQYYLDYLIKEVINE